MRLEAATRGAVCLLIWLACWAAPLQAEPVWGRRGMVASDHELASQAGAEMLRAGGNAIDAAVATAFALGVVRPYSTGIGGGGFMVIHLRDGSDQVLDYRERAPQQAHRDMFLDQAGAVIPHLSETGHRAVAVPGAVDGLLHALTKYGTLPRAQVLAPAIRYAAEGFEVDLNFVKNSRLVLPLMQQYPEMSRIFLQGGQPLPLGGKLVQGDLARTLRLIADQGRPAFYQGEIARALAQAMEGKGLITLADLKQYKHRLLQPLTGTYRGYSLVAMPPPSSGGSTIIEILNILENYPLPSPLVGHNSSEYLHLVAEGMKHAFNHRAQYLGDPAFVKIPLDKLLSKESAKLFSRRIDRFQTQPSETYGSFTLPEDAGTSHFSVSDAQGNAVACTETVNTLFGSKVVVPGTGIVLNNEMDDFSLRPGVPNHYGLIGSEANAIAPGKAPLSSMSPTLVLKDGQPYLSVGASGGPRIITATLQTILNVLDFGMNIEAAIIAPRIHHQWSPDTLMLEEGIPADVVANLRAKGHRIKIGIPRSAVQGIHIQDGLFYGASDPRKGGRPVGY